MKAALTLTLTVSLVASSLPAAAQFPYLPPPRRAPATQQYAPPPQAPPSNWARVRAIAPGSRVRVTAVGLGGQDNQYFVSASDRNLTVLVVGGLPRSATHLAIHVAAEHPGLFMAPDKWMEFTEDHVRANPDGFFVRGRKVADLSEVAKTIDAGDVAEVTAMVRDDRPEPTHIDPGFEGVAAILPISALALACGDGGHCTTAAAWGILLGVPIAIGVVHGIRAHHRTRPEIVYRAR
jgi:hypothetical protein